MVASLYGMVPIDSCVGFAAANVVTSASPDVNGTVVCAFQEVDLLTAFGTLPGEFTGDITFDPKASGNIEVTGFVSTTGWAGQFQGNQLVGSFTSSVTVKGLSLLDLEGSFTLTR